MRHVLLEGVVGSTAYGLNHADSDIDKLGVFIYPTDEILGLKNTQDSIVTTNPDRTLHEVLKFIQLCLNSNPTVMELLWLPEYTTCNFGGHMLVAARDVFLSNKIRNTYGGYARQQAKKLAEKGDFGSDLKKRQAKHGRHCTRLLLQGVQALQTGKITVRLTLEQAQTCTLMGEMAASSPELFAADIESMFEAFDATKSVLPDEPNYDRANDILLQLRKVY